MYYAPYPYTGEDSIGSFDLGNINSISFTLWNNAAFYTAIKVYNKAGESEFSNVELFKLIDSNKNTFVMIHFEAGYKGRLDNDLSIELPEKYRVMDFGWQEYLYGVIRGQESYSLFILIMLHFSNAQTITSRI